MSKETKFYHSQPSTEWEALMIAAPHQEIESNLDDSFLIREDIADSIDMLPSQQRQIFEMLFIERITQDQIAEELGIARVTVQRERDRAVRTLQTMLSAKGYGQ